MKISTMSIVVGTRACNARCPYCVSKMTPGLDVNQSSPDSGELNSHVVRNLRKSLLFAERSGVSTILLTGKGEPTLYPRQVKAYLEEIQRANFPFVELQTNGFLIPKRGRWLAECHLLGLTAVSISVVSQHPGENKAIMGVNLDLAEAVKSLHEIGLSVRINCTMLKSAVDDWDKVEKLIDWCRDRNVEQLTLREVTAPPEKCDYSSEEKQAAQFVKEHKLDRKTLHHIRGMCELEGTLLMHLPHGADVYDFHGQNVCLSNCLTPPNGEEIRQIIFFPDGHLRYDWVYPGAIIF